MTRDFFIREAEPDDAGQILEFLKELYGEPGILLNTQPDEFDLTVEDELQFITRLKQQSNSLFLVATIEGKIIGILTCKGGNRSVNYHDTQLGIVIHQEWRSRGAGNTLMNAAIEWARANDFVQRISLNVYDDNARAIHLYSKLGFKIEGRRHKALFKHGRYYDELIMGLLLADD